MSFEERLIKSRRLAELKEEGRHSIFQKGAKEPVDVDLRNSLEKKSKEFQIELRAKHMTEGQLNALLEFYESDMGISIVKSGQEITKEFKNSFLKRMNTPPPAIGDTGFIVRSTDANNEDDDT